MILNSRTTCRLTLIVAIALPLGISSVLAATQEGGKTDTKAEVEPRRIIEVESETESSASKLGQDSSRQNLEAIESEKESAAVGELTDVEPDSNIRSEAEASAATVKSLKSLGWLSPLLILLIALLILWFLLELMTRYLRSGNQVATANSKGRAGQTESEFGRIFLSRPARVDDLAQVSGIDAEKERRLNSLGIYQFDQLKNMTPGQRAALERKVGLPRLNWESLSKLGNLTRANSSETIPESTLVEVASASATALTGVAVASAVKPSSAVPAQSKVSATVPKPHFNRKSSMSKIDASSSALVAADEATGSAQKSTIVPASRQSESKRALEDLRPGRDAKSSETSDSRTEQGTLESRTESTGSAIQSSKIQSRPTIVPESAEQTDEGKLAFGNMFGTLHTSAPTDADDLTRLAGIDAAVAARLNASGIYRFDQLNDLDEKQEALLSKQFGLQDADFADWQRCMYAWGRGINTSADIDEVHEIGELHGISLPQIAAGIFDGARLIAYPEQVIFRGSNPEGWGRGGGDEIEGVSTSLSCEAIRSDINYIRIRRTDTRESVVLPISKGKLFANGDSSENGWNGSSEVFFGGRHIGAFGQQLPQEVETKFSLGGWGFGHRYEHNDRQEWGWAGRVIEPTAFEISVGCIGELPVTVVFRSSDPAIWNTRTREGEFRMANPISLVSHAVSFVRIMRLATGEAIIVRVAGEHVLDEGLDPRCGWNGSASNFCGGSHLGVYHSNLPQDFETRFEFGGWGFGHPYDDNNRQAWGWAGRQLSETVFEISLLESVPEFMSHEVVE